MLSIFSGLLLVHFLFFHQSLETHVDKLRVREERRLSANETTAVASPAVTRVGSPIDREREQRRRQAFAQQLVNKKNQW